MQLLYDPIFARWVFGADVTRGSLKCALRTMFRYFPDGSLWWILLGGSPKVCVIRYVPILPRWSSWWMLLGGSIKISLRNVPILARWAFVVDVTTVEA